jgi:hypothetical protein
MNIRPPPNYRAGGATGSTRVKGFDLTKGLTRRHPKKNFKFKQFLDFNKDSCALHEAHT